MCALIILFSGKSSNAYELIQHHNDFHAQQQRLPEEEKNFLVGFHIILHKINFLLNVVAFVGCGSIFLHTCTFMCKQKNKVRRLRMMSLPRKYLEDKNHQMCSQEATVKLILSIQLNQVQPQGDGIRGSGKELVGRVVKIFHFEVY